MPKPKSLSHDTDIFQYITLGFICIVLFPVVLATLILTIALYKIRSKGLFILLLGVIGLFTMSLFLPNTILIYLSDISDSIKKVIAYVNENKHIEMLGILFQISFSSFIISILISISISGYLLENIYADQKLTDAGINTFERSINKVSDRLSRPTISSNKSVDVTEKTLIGVNQAKKQIYSEDNAKHIFACGTTGSGKTVLLSNFIKSGIEKNYGMLIVDGKGDIGKGSILEITKQFTEQYNKKLYIINLNNPKTSDKYNPFKGASETICKDMLINMTDWSEEHYKTNTERYLQKLLKLLNIKGQKLSYKTIIENMSIQRFEELSISLAKENKISKEEHLLNVDLIKASGKIAENAAARFATIAESDIGTIFDESGDENGIDIYTALNKNAVILFILNPLIYPELSPVMGRLILIDAKKAISKMFGDNRRKFFILDEINVYASTVLIDLINKSRSAGITAIPATQSLSDLEANAGEPFKHQIIENCNNYIILRQNSAKNAEEWAKTIGTQEKMQITYQINNTETTNVGTARKTREFIVHPDDIKKLKIGDGTMSRKSTS